VKALEGGKAGFTAAVGGHVRLVPPVSFAMVTATTTTPSITFISWLRAAGHEQGQLDF
jgi:hypothetical protein